MTLNSYRNIFVLVAFGILSSTTLHSQNTNDDVNQIHKVCLGYLEGFYEGDEEKLKQSISENLYKYGYWKSDGKYSGEQMSYTEALKFAKDVKENKKFAKKTAIKKVEILDAISHIASAKITAWWGVDYALLSKKEGKWIIEQILWQGPLKHID